VQRKRRILYGYLILQAILVLIVFPLLFIHYENGEIARAIEKAANVDLPPESRQYLSYADGLYWSIITAASIGYGDVTPVTQGGKIIAALLGTMGVLTVGVIAGLILNWITPRELD
jgi:voltage-gated potassium channel Kch